MLIFYTNDVEEVVLASIVKHYNPNAIIREYEDNEDLLSIAKMHNESFFIRVKDYKLGILNKYEFPAWIKNDTRIKYLELLLSHKKTNTYEVINHLSHHLFHPEEIFYSANDTTNNFKNRIIEVVKEINAFKKMAKKEYKNGLLYYHINPEHNITQSFLQSVTDPITETVIVLNQDYALVGNAQNLGFKEKIVKMERFDAFKIKKKLQISMPRRQAIKTTIATKISEY